MNIILAIVCAIVLCDTALLAYCLGVIHILNKQPSAISAHKLEDTAVYKMSEDDLKEFLEADAAATKGFRDAIAGLNAFMTGREQEDGDVEQQELE